MNKFTIQSTGKDVIEKIYMDGKPAQYMVANTRHYSWPKGAGKFYCSILSMRALAA